MKKLLYGIGAALYALIIANLLRFGFNFLSLMLLSSSALEIVFFFIILGLAVVDVILYFVMVGTMYPLIKLCSLSKYSKFLPILIFGICGISSTIFPWFYIDGFRDGLLALFLSSSVLFVFGMYVVGIWSTESE